MKAEFKNNILSFETENFIIKYSNLEIVKYDEEEKPAGEELNMFNDWMYMYYNVSLFAKITINDKVTESLIASIKTIDEPTLAALCKSIEILLDSTSEGVYDTIHRCNVETQSYDDALIQEDTYELRKYMCTNDKGEKNEWYWLNISLFPSQDMSAIGITFSFIEKKELIEMAENIAAFIYDGLNKVQ